MGRSKYSQKEIKIIRMLLGKKCAGTRFQQKQIRHQLRVNFEFNISDFGEQGKAFGPDELDRCVERGIIKILDDATIAAMKEKRERDRLRDLDPPLTPPLMEGNTIRTALPIKGVIVRSATLSEKDMAEDQRGSDVLSDEEAEAVWKKALEEWEAWENENKK